MSARQLEGPGVSGCGGPDCTTQSKAEGQLSRGMSGGWPCSAPPCTGASVCMYVKGVCVMVFCCILTPSPRSDERQQPLAHGHRRRPVHAQWLQQWPGHLMHGRTVHTAAAPSLWGPAAQQAQALPGHPAAVRQRHLPRDRGACAHAGAGARGESGGDAVTPGRASLGLCPPLPRLKPSVFFPRTPR